MKKNNLCSVKWAKMQWREKEKNNRLKKPQQQLSFVLKCTEGNDHYCGVFNGFGKYCRGSSLPFPGLLRQHCTCIWAENFLIMPQSKWCGRAQHLVAVLLFWLNMPCATCLSRKGGNGAFLFTVKKAMSRSSPSNLPKSHKHEQVVIELKLMSSPTRS